MKPLPTTEKTCSVPNASLEHKVTLVPLDSLWMIHKIKKSETASERKLVAMTTTQHHLSED